MILPLLSARKPCWTYGRRSRSRFTVEPVGASLSAYAGVDQKGHANQHHRQQGHPDAAWDQGPSRRAKASFAPKEGADQIDAFCWCRLYSTSLFNLWGRVI